MESQNEGVMKASDLVFVTFQYTVIALRKSNGEQVWETKVLDRFFKPTDAFIALLVDDSGVYAHVVNEVVCLDFLTGNIIWRKGLGKGGWFASAGIPSIAVLGANPAMSTTQAAAYKAIQARKSDGGAA